MTDPCSIPGCGHVAASSLPLKRDKSGRWFVTPVCKRCEHSLKREARAADRTLKFFGLEGSKREAEKRNAQGQSLRALLTDFAKPRVKEELKRLDRTSAR